ncbi:hypothetical protein [Sphingobacterium sp. LRF_L2]|uniref:hypothetical protein n=1 Tax=Sphingobacterium sp. LRF_L2 TaxID=3369421 RepID=UPI003F5F8087
MKNIQLLYKGKMRTIRFDPVEDYFGRITARVYDKNDKSYLFTKNMYGRFISDFHSAHWPIDLKELIDQILQKEIPIIKKKPGIYGKDV